nr:TetR/AcrR family transcriptional regulator [Modestobacter versicolor]
MVDAAERVLVRDGLGGLTVRAVATEAGVAPMGVYNRFGSKDGLVAAVLTRGFEGLRAAAMASEVPDPVDRLLACGHGYRQFALDHPQHYGAMFGAGFASAAPTEELVDRAAAAFQVLVDQVGYAMDRAVLRPGDRLETAQVIWSSVHGAVSLELAGMVQVADPGANYEQLLRMLLDGLR